MVVAVYTIWSVYVPLGNEVVALAANHTVVVSATAVVDVVLSIIGAPFAGIPAHNEVLDALLDSAPYDASKPFVPIPVVPVLTANPHVLFSRAIGVVLVPVLAAKLLPPLASVLVASPSSISKLYPVALFVSTVTVSLSFDSTPPDVGVNNISTAGPVPMLMTGSTIALIVWFVSSNAAEAIAGDKTTPTIAAIAVHALIRCFMFVLMVFSRFLFYIKLLPAK